MRSLSSLAHLSSVFFCEEATRLSKCLLSSRNKYYHDKILGGVDVKDSKCLTFSYNKKFSCGNMATPDGIFVKLTQGLRVLYVSIGCSSFDGITRCPDERMRLTIIYCSEVSSHKMVIFNSKASTGIVQGTRYLTRSSQSATASHYRKRRGQKD